MRGRNDKRIVFNVKRYSAEEIKALKEKGILKRSHSHFKAWDFENKEEK